MSFSWMAASKSGGGRKAPGREAGSKEDYGLEEGMEDPGREWGGMEDAG
jgi:hypothetical protein